jgi:hydroxyacylglutathione hydrolase
MISSMIDFTTGAPNPVDLDVRWIHGSRSARDNTDPKIQVHACDPHTFILRQSKAVNYEAPFLYLLCGNDRALLLDTGATTQPELFPLRETVDAILDSWLRANPRDSYELVVAHTHGHHDHIAADSQFAGRPDTIMVPGDVASVQSYFQITSWPVQVVQCDLGGRVLDVTGIPGHHPASIVVYDPWTGFLVTGDTVYPGRLFARDMPVFAVSMERLAQFAQARPVTHVMGCHIEMTRRPGRDYPIGALYQPDEPPLQMTVQQLAAVRTATAKVAGKPGAHVFNDFIIFNGPCKLAIARQSARLLWSKIRKPAARPAARA